MLAACFRRSTKGGLLSTAQLFFKKEKLTKETFGFAKRKGFASQNMVKLFLKVYSTAQLFFIAIPFPFF